MEQARPERNNQTRYQTLEPPRCHVVFHNDDVTTMDFVEMVLMRVFRKEAQEAETLMMKVHTEGQAVVGTYSFDIAHSRTNLTIQMARAEGFPLQVTVEEA